MLFRFSAKEQKSRRISYLFFQNAEGVRGTKSSPTGIRRRNLVPSRKTVGFKAFAARNLRFILLSQQVENPRFQLKKLFYLQSALLHRISRRNCRLRRLHIAVCHMRAVYQIGIFQAVFVLRLEVNLNVLSLLLP